jgi:hypothetical protein
LLLSLRKKGLCSGMAAVLRAPPGMSSGPEDSVAGARGRSSEAEHQLPKLRTRVRFPSPALDNIAGGDPCSSDVPRGRNPFIPRVPRPVRMRLDFAPAQRDPTADGFRNSTCTHGSPDGSLRAVLYTPHLARDSRRVVELRGNHPDPSPRSISNGLLRNGRWSGRGRAVAGRARSYISPP